MNSIHAPSRTPFLHLSLLLWVRCPRLLVRLILCIHPSLHHGSGHTRALGILEQSPPLGRRIPRRHLHGTRCRPPAARWKQTEQILSGTFAVWFDSFSKLTIGTSGGSGLMAILAAVVTGSGVHFYMALLLIYVPLVYSPGREISTGCKSDFFFFFFSRDSGS